VYTSKILNLKIAKQNVSISQYVDNKPIWQITKILVLQKYT